MTYNKDETLKLVDAFGETFAVCQDSKECIEDVKYALSLGLIAYTQHVQFWLLEGYIPQDTNNKVYYETLSKLHEFLCEKGAFKA